MNRFAAELEWIDAQYASMCELLTEWASINTGSYNLWGLQKFLQSLRDRWAAIGGKMRTLDLPEQEAVDERGRITHLPLGKALSVRKRSKAPRRVFLGIHMDTVYPADHPFQHVTRLDADRLRGPGVTDAKGGLIILLHALEAFERSQWAEQLGWEVLINPDEEIGSPGSETLLIDCARRTQLGLIFEPALPDGSLVSARKGSGNFTLVVRGKAAHVGRAFAAGRSAIHAMGELIGELEAINDRLPGTTVNVGRIDGGGQVNVVADLALARFNIRVDTPDQSERVQAEVNRIVKEVATRRDGIAVELHGRFHCPPKPLNDPTLHLLEYIADCGRDLGLDLSWRPTGGVSDGNKLAAAGLPTIDTLGARGGMIHSPEEYIELPSLIERARLTALLLMKLASGELDMEALR